MHGLFGDLSVDSKRALMNKLQSSGMSDIAGTASKATAEFAESAESFEMKDRLNAVTNIIIAAAICVHRALGPGLLESAYSACLGCELWKRGL